MVHCVSSLASSLLFPLFPLWKGIMIPVTWSSVIPQTHFVWSLHIFCCLAPKKSSIWCGALGYLIWTHSTKNQELCPILSCIQNLSPSNSWQLLMCSCYLLSVSQEMAIVCPRPIGDTWQFRWWFLSAAISPRCCPCVWLLCPDRVSCEWCLHFVSPQGSLGSTPCARP